MKKLSFFVLVTLFPLLSLQAQQLKIDSRFGKVSEDELRMESYDKDLDAAAVVLHEDVYASYQFEGDTKLCYDYRCRIKILKPEGTSYADVTLPYVETHLAKEMISGLDAVAYNLEGGKVVKTPMKKQYVFREQTSKTGRVLKFSIPDVKAGTVIEYRYKKTSDFYFYIPKFRFQHDIPTMQGYYEAALPEFYRFNVSMKGYTRINYHETTSSATLGPTAYTIRHIICEPTDIPALKSEPYIWCLNDFRSTFDFEISQIAMPHSMVTNYSTSWTDVNDALYKSSFDTHTKIGNPYKDEVAALVTGDSTPADKAHAVLKLVQSKIKWDGNYRLISKGPRAAASKGSGSSADINFILMAALKDAGFKVVPILLNPRHMGRLPYSRASIDEVNAFILRITLDDGSEVFVDGTNPDSDLNILPLNLLVDRARIYGVNGEEGWCDLTKISQGIALINITLRLNEDNTITGTVVEDYTNQEALLFSTRCNMAASREKFIENQAKENEIEMTEVDIQGLGTSKVKQSYKLTQHPNNTDEYVYLNATCIPFMSTNWLNAQSRLLPVEFSHPMAYHIRYTIELPEGYTVEEMPKGISMAVCDDGIRCRYISQQSGSIIQGAFSFIQSRIVYTAGEYADLSTFFGLVTNLSNSKIVIKKK